MSTGSIGQVITINKGLITEFSYSLTLRRPASDSQPAIEYGIAANIPVFAVTSSISLPAMHFRGVYTDALGLYDQLGAIRIGDELELILFRDIDDENKLEKKFYITELTNTMQSQNAQRKQYTITALTKSGILNKDSPLTKAFKKQPASEIAKTICEKVLLVPAKELEDFSPTTGEIDIIFSHQTPFSALQELCARSVRDQQDQGQATSAPSLFYCWEDTLGMHYKTTSDMLKDGKQNATIYKHYPTASRTESQDDYYRIQHYTQRRGDSLSKTVDQGTLNNEVFAFNLKNRSFSNKTFNFEKDSSQALVFGKHPGFDAKSLATTRAQDASQSSKANTNIIQYICDDQSYDRPEDHRLTKTPATEAHKQLLQQNTLTIKILGNPDLNPGDLITMVSAAKNQRDTVDGSGDPHQVDRRLTGTYLVGSVRHDVAEALNFFTIVDLYKDAYEVDVVNPNNG